MLKKCIKLLRDIIEVYIPMLALLCLFIVFLVQVFFRYILNNPQAWTMEASLICFVWLVMFGASYALRKKSHVTFKLVYDKLPHTQKHILSIAGNLVLIVAFAILIKPSYDFIKFMDFQSTYIFKIKFSLVYAPILYFMLATIVYQAIELYESILSIRKKEDVTILDRESTALQAWIEKHSKAKEEA